MRLSFKHLFSFIAAGALIVAGSASHFPALPVLAPEAAAQSSFGMNSFKRLSDEEVGVILKKIRHAQFGECCLKFTIKHVPRKSDETVTHTGVLWTGRRNSANVFRLELDPPSGAKAEAQPLRLLLRSGVNGELWMNGGAGGAPVRADATSNTPFHKGLIFTPLELQTPFIFWEQIQYKQTTRFRGRPTHFFEATPPADFKTANPNIRAIRFGTDKGFDNFVILQAVVLDKEGDEVRRFEAETFTRVKDSYIPEEMRVLDVKSRDKDIFRVTAAAVNITHQHGVFDPATLNQPAPRPPESEFVKVE